MNTKNREFDNIIMDITENENFQKMKNIIHHGHNRYDHSIRVAYYSYKVSKLLKLDYVKATRGALLHDFFLEENQSKTLKDKMKIMLNHPKYAKKNASKYFKLSNMEKDIILTHMFPISLNPPKYLESWIVDLVDDGISIYERFIGIQSHLSFATSFIFALILNYTRFKV